MKKILIIIILLCISTPVKASCTLVMDASSGRVLFGENEHSKHLIASTTKIMTAFVTLNNSDINKKTKVGDEVIDAYKKLDSNETEDIQKMKRKIEQEIDTLEKMIRKIERINSEKI